MSRKTKNTTVRLVRAAVIAALYTALTYFVFFFGLSGTGAVQLRISEALCILPIFTAAAVPGLTVGCLLANLLTGAALPDLIFGTLATLIGAVGTRLLRRTPALAFLPPILSNTVIIPFVIRYAYVDVSASLPFLFLTVGVGELLSVGLFGAMLYPALSRYRNVLFSE